RLAGDRQALAGIGQGQQQEHLVAQEITLGRGHEDAAIAHVSHVGAIQPGLVLDLQGQDALASACSTHPLFPLSSRAGDVVVLRARSRQPSSRSAIARSPLTVLRNSSRVRFALSNQAASSCNRTGGVKPEEASPTAYSAEWRRRSSPCSSAPQRWATSSGSARPAPIAARSAATSLRRASPSPSSQLAASPGW